MFNNELIACEIGESNNIKYSRNKQRIRSFNLPRNKKITGDKILIQNADQDETVLSVSSIQISTSMAERKNIGICIGKLASPDLVQVGTSIYSLEN